MSTPGANFVTKNVIMEGENKTIQFEIWDTAGRKISFISKSFL